MHSRVKGMARIIDSKNGTDIKIYDVRDISNITDYLIIASANNRRHIQAVCNEILLFLTQNSISLIGTEGMERGNWALIDCGRFVIHIFRPETREFYDLELIWGDAPLIEWVDHGSD